jgi:CMP-N-acetylneuraminic acid synthetase
MNIKNNILCIIPARGGSKGIPNKNLKKLNRYPLIHYIIKSVKENNIFNRIIVSTDSKEIGEYCKKEKIDFPFLRPKKLSGDEVLVEDVIEHALKYIEKKDKKYNYVCVCQPTSPLILGEDIIEVYKLLKRKNGDMVISVSEPLQNTNWIGEISYDLLMNNFKDSCGTRRQGFGKAYILNGAIYMGKWDIFYEKRNYYRQMTYAYIIPKERSIDIDNIFDFKMCELLIRDRGKK